MWKKCNVVMLPTNQKATNNCIILSLDSTRLSLANRAIHGNKIFEVDHEFTNGNYIPQHLYITSDEEIKEGDYCFNLQNKSFRQNNGNQNELSLWKLNPQRFKKIIATTDASLKVHHFNKGVFKDLEYSLPQPSQQFIEKYISEYNKGNIITDVMVEYTEEYDWSLEEDAINFPVGEKPKINSNNTITIKKVKDSWSREEHFENIYQFAKFANNIFDSGKIISEEDVNKWIKENL